MTTAAILTPAGRGAVSVIAIDGPQAAHVVEKFLHTSGAPNIAQRPLGRIIYGRWGDNPAEDVIACRRATNQVEIHCHGGAAAAQRILADLTSAGAAVQSWTDWIDHHETSPLRAAAHAALANTTTQRTASILLDQYHGALESSLRQIIAHLDSANPSAAATILSQLLTRASLGLHLTQPWRVVIAGPPNVGKSSLLNALLGFRRAIVFNEPGTTRDVVTSTTAIDGWPVELSDTAGLRSSDDPLESAGAARATQQAQSADCLLLVFDVSQPWTAAHQQLVETWPSALVVGNKCDLILSQSSRTFPAHLFTSALSGEGIENSLQEIAARLVPMDLQPGDPLPFCQSQVDQLQRSKEALNLDNMLAARNALIALLATG